MKKICLFCDISLYQRPVCAGAFWRFYDDFDVLANDLDVGITDLRAKRYKFQYLFSSESRSKLAVLLRRTNNYDRVLEDAA
jgi:hypothetical protein